MQRGQTEEGTPIINPIIVKLFPMTSHPSFGGSFP